MCKRSVTASRIAARWESGRCWKAQRLALGSLVSFSFDRERQKDRNDSRRVSLPAESSVCSMSSHLAFSFLYTHVLRNFTTTFFLRRHFDISKRAATEYLYIVAFSIWREQVAFLITREEISRWEKTRLIDACLDLEHRSDLSIPPFFVLLFPFLFSLSFISLTFSHNRQTQISRRNKIKKRMKHERWIWLPYR